MREIVYSVKQLNTLVKNTLLLEPKFNRITVEGEVSNLRTKTSNHVYFSVKDEESTLSCMIGSWNKGSIDLSLLENGAKILLTGKLQVYVPYGKYTFLVTGIKPIGKGDLFAQFEILKEKLEEEGLFDDIHKKSLPVFPKKIGVITSDSGDAIKDITSGIEKKNKLVEILIFPAKVQGDGAAESISHMIELANTFHDIDLIIVGRGGGSIEDLWAFNEELTVRSIFNSKIPIISAVGHENDHTISDWVADMRAKTPTEAGEIAVPNIDELKEDIKFIAGNMADSIKLLIVNLEKDTENNNPTKNKNSLYERIRRIDLEGKNIINQMNRMLNDRIQGYGSKVNRLIDGLDIKTLLQRCDYNLESLKSKLNPNRLIQEKEYKLEILKRDIVIKNRIESLINMIDIQKIKLESFNPLSIMSKGYTLVTDDSGNIIKSIDNVNKGDEVNLKLTGGFATAEIMNIEKDN